MLGRHHFAREVAATIAEGTGEEYPHYFECLFRAFDEFDPVFSRERYAEFFYHCAGVPGWLANTLLANANVESDGSAKLLGLWEQLEHGNFAERDVWEHARDEAGHSRIFVSLAGLVFPELGDPLLQGIRKGLIRIPRSLEKKAATINQPLLLDHLVQMNLGEIRTRVHMHLFAPVLFAIARPEHKTRVEEIVTRLHADEVRHIGYTARLLELACQNGDRELISGLFRRRLHDFHCLTVRQTEGTVRKYSQGMFPDLLEICSCHWCPVRGMD